jgi:hypothetical protein
MHNAKRLRRSALEALALAAVVLAWPGFAAAQILGLGSPAPATSTAAITGTAAAVRATASGLLGGTVALADTGTLTNASDARDVGQSSGAIASALTGEALHAVTISWPDQVASEASLGNLALSVAGNTIGADLVLARALAVAGAAGSGSSELDNLIINGAPVPVTGAPNQTIPILGGSVVINQQSASAGGMVVNALRVIVDGVADVAVGSVTAAIQ